MDFSVPADYKIEIKESVKIDKYLDIARELKSQWNIKVIVISNIVDNFGTVPTGLIERFGELEIGEEL